MLQCGQKVRCQILPNFNIDQISQFVHLLDSEDNDVTI